ncbi:MAG: sugar ABC transporter permease [Paracoccaceae bacterium]
MTLADLPRSADTARPAATPATLQRRTAWVLTAPALILMAVILLIPVSVAVVLSFTDYSLGNAGFDWVGLANYEKLLTRSAYARMFAATFTYVLVVVPLSVGLGLGAALLINSLGRFRDVYKTIYFLPVMATLIAMAIAWEFMLHPTIGTVNRTLAAGCGTWVETAWPWLAMHCDEGMPLWLGDKRYAIWVICFVGIWQGFGFNMVLYLAGLTSVHRELYHAAEMDGVRSGWERFRLVTWPALGPTTVFVVTISCIRAFQLFDTIEAFYPIGAGPGKSAYVMMYAIFEKGVKQNLVGIGSAITVLFLVFVMMITLIQRWLVERKVHYA